MDVARLIEALSRSAAYPYPVDHVEVRQTHISAVFLADPFVYKVKKPVNLGFLDFSTLEKRHHFCQEEVRLNARLAPEAYVGVVPVVKAAHGPCFEAEGPAIEWAVKMQRLPDDVTFLERLRRGALKTELAETLAGRIAGFHRRAEGGARIAEFGRFEAIRRVIQDIYSQSEAHVGVTVGAAVFGRLRSLAEGELNRLRWLIDDRAARGVPRDCHGDLHLDHVYYFEDRQPPRDLVIIDCIEFNERFRFGDPVADMAFPAMDFAFYGRRDLARTFAEAYFRASGDDAGRALLPMYVAYRATVRGSVEGMLVGETEVSEAERAAARTRARAHWLLALGELEQPGRRPGLVLVTGLPGTGKSSLARKLSEAGHFRVIRSDVVRKELAGSPDASLPESFYTAEWNARIYAECLRRAEALLFEGERVLVDANFREERERSRFLKCARGYGVIGCLLLCKTAPATVRRRLQERSGDASDADWSVYQKVAQEWEEPGPETALAMRDVSTEGSFGEAYERATVALREFGLWS
jgi:aminoglycoside phosphotransferase family enzyme/predicted kinase